MFHSTATRSSPGTYLYLSARGDTLSIYYNTTYFVTVSTSLVGYGGFTSILQSIAANRWQCHFLLIVIFDFPKTMLMGHSILMGSQ